MNREPAVKVEDSFEEREMPEKRLLKAILWRAMLDILYHTRPTNAERKIASGAMDWLVSDGDERFSFLWTCEALDIDGEHVRRIAYNLRDAVQRGWKLRRRRRAERTVERPCSLADQIRKYGIAELEASLAQAIGAPPPPNESPSTILEENLSEFLGKQIPCFR